MQPHLSVVAALTGVLAFICGQVCLLPQSVNQGLNPGLQQTSAIQRPTGLGLEYAPQWGWYNPPTSTESSLYPSNSQQQQQGTGTRVGTQQGPGAQYPSSAGGQGPSIAGRPTYVAALGPGTFTDEQQVQGQAEGQGGFPPYPQASPPGQPSQASGPQGQTQTTTYSGTVTNPGPAGPYAQTHTAPGSTTGQFLSNNGQQQQSFSGQSGVGQQPYVRPAGWPGQSSFVAQQSSIIPGLQSGQQSGLLSSGQQSGPLSFGQQSGPLSFGQQSGLFSTGHQAGVSSTGQQTGVSSTGQQNVQQAYNGTVAAALSNLLRSKVALVGSAVRGGVQAVLWLPRVLLEALRPGPAPPTP